MLTDGIDSMAIYNYDVINWSFSEEAIEENAIVSTYFDIFGEAV